MQSCDMNVLFLFLTISAFEFLMATGTQNVIVETKNGKILGETYGTTPNTKVNQFIGIPFAAPPIGELRFQDPQPVRPWQPRILNATRFGSICIQPEGVIDTVVKAVWPSFTKDNYSEDCLYLNVYAPAQNDPLNPTKHYPVMVYIHGGSFLLGTGILSPGMVLVQYGVVLVTIQYRLGPFGFMSTGDSVAAGNYGMLDQVMALKWVNENIKNFGGDYNKVTIFGLSAGGASVGLQLLSPLAKNFVHGAISESGVDLSPWAVINQDVIVAETVHIAEQLGCKDSEHKVLVDCLRSKDARSFFSVATKSTSEVTWGPVVDKTNRENPFLPDNPLNLRRTNKINKVPYMVGFMPNDGAYFLGYLTNKSVDLGMFKLAMKNQAMEGLSATTNKDLITMIQNALEFQYTPWGETADSSKLRQKMGDALTDYLFAAPSVLTSTFHSLLAPSYLFEFNYRSKLADSEKWMGPTHVDNFIFDFGIPLLTIPGLPNYDATDKNLTKLVMTMYTNFAKSGNPTPNPLPNGVQWTAFNSTNLAYLRIQPYPEMKSNFMPHRMAFWNEYRPSLVESVPRCNDSDKKPVNDGVRIVAPFMAFVFFISGTTILFVCS